MAVVDISDRDFKEPWRPQTLGAPTQFTTDTKAEATLIAPTGAGIVQSIILHLSAATPATIGVDMAYIYVDVECIPNGESDTGEAVRCVPVIWDSTETSTRKTASVVIPLNCAFSDGCTVKWTVAKEPSGLGSFTDISGLIDVVLSQ